MAVFAGKLNRAQGIEFCFAELSYLKANNVEGDWETLDRGREATALAEVRAARPASPSYLPVPSCSIACITGTFQLLWLSQKNCILSAVASTFCRSMVKLLRLAL